jgi:DNA-binding beta-propeller fold protein YncE
VLKIKVLMFIITLFIVAACNTCTKPPEPDDKPVLYGEFAFIGTSDYSDGYLCSINGDSLYARKDIILIHNDAVLAAYKEMLYILERKDSDKIVKVDPQDNYNRVSELSVGAGSNPHALAFASDTKAYVSRNNATKLWIINPNTMTKTGEIDLHGYVAYAGTDSAEATPKMTEMVLTGGKLYVALQRLKGWDPGDTSLVLVINTTTDQVEKAIALNNKNPYGMSLYGTKIYIACVGQWSDANWMPVYDGGVEVINTATNTNEGVLVRETDIPSNISDVMVVSDNKGYMVIPGTWPANEVLPFDPTDGTVGTKLIAIAQAAKMGVSKGGDLYILERADSTAGVYVLDPATDTVLRGPIETGLPPNAIVFIDFK